MIDLNDIIEAAETLIKDKSTVLVLHRNMQVHPKFKVYKTFEYKLYTVSKTDNSKKLTLDESFTVNAPSDNIAQLWEKHDKDFLAIFLKWITTKEFIEWT